MKKLFSMFVAVAFALSMVGVAFAADNAAKAAPAKKAETTGEVKAEKKAPAADNAAKAPAKKSEKKKAEKKKAEKKEGEKKAPAADNAAKAPAKPAEKK